jgi:predicted  nucleic acid-binding Zn-ribbon protein
MKTPVQVKLLMKLHKLEENGEGANRKAVLKEIEKGLDPSLLKRYLKLRERKGTGVALLKHRTCTGCNMAYTETHEILRYKNFIHSCEYCGRLLIVNAKAS